MIQKNTLLGVTDKGIKSISSTLKTLCILTFIGVGILNFYGPIYHYYNIDKNISTLEQQINELKSAKNDAAVITQQDALDGFYKARDNKVQNLLVDIIAGILCVIGALLMMRLLKIGFFVYTAGQLLPAIYHYLIFGIGKGDFSITTSIYIIVIPLAFIVLYAMQLGDME